ERMRPVARWLSAVSLALAASVAQAQHGATAPRLDADSAASAIGAQESRGIDPAAHGAGGEAPGPVDIITPHITDAPHMEVPYWAPPFYKEVHLPHWAPVQVGGLSLDLSPTKHVVMMLLAATLCALTLITAAAAHRRHSHAVGRPRGFAAGIEAMVLYLRNEVVLPNVGHHGNAFVPFILTLFFFILFANLLGLIPFGSTATGNISVTGTLAVITFLVVEAAGVRAQGLGYLNTIIYWNKDLPIVMRVLMAIIMSPVEMVGKITKPFALAIRLFANMTAGHIVVLALIGLFFGFVGTSLTPGSIVAIAPLLMAVAIMILELFVAFLQAFIFALLASVFIGQIREAHH
ncbi:MAG: ATP synthase F0 sector subunit a, partial [uncultured Solirubrobacteraceae bacterium]